MNRNQIDRFNFLSHPPSIEKIGDWSQLTVLEKLDVWSYPNRNVTRLIKLNASILSKFIRWWFTWFNWTIKNWFLKILFKTKFCRNFDGHQHHHTWYNMNSVCTCVCATFKMFCSFYNNVVLMTTRQKNHKENKFCSTVSTIGRSTKNSMAKYKIIKLRFANQQNAQIAF